MTGPADWPTLTAIALVAVIAWGLGFWFAWQVRKTTAEIEVRQATATSEVELRLRRDMSDLKAEFVELRARLDPRGKS